MLSRDCSQSENIVQILFLSDIKLPNRDGFELLRDIRALGPENGGSVPVIAVTAFGRVVDRNRTIAAGFGAHLEKPFCSGEAAGRNPVKCSEINNPDA
jgi:CheY-like chemotaxis protein